MCCPTHWPLSQMGWPFCPALALKTCRSGIGPRAKVSRSVDGQEKRQSWGAFTHKGCRAAYRVSRRPRLIGDDAAFQDECLVIKRSAISSLMADVGDHASTRPATHFPTRPLSTSFETLGLPALPKRQRNVDAIARPNSQWLGDLNSVAGIPILFSPGLDPLQEQPDRLGAAL